MQYTALFLAAAAATASAQVTYNSTTGVFTCPKDNPNGAFCAGDSLSTNIIIRCNNGVGQPGNCNDNLSGYFPYGVNYAPCWQTSTTSGDAACSKNCIVEGGSGNFNGTFTLPNCTPVPNPSTTTSTTTTGSSTASVSSTASTTSVPTSSASASTTAISTTTTYAPPSNTTTTVCPTGSTTGSTTLPGNSTITTITTAGRSSSATATPVGPTGTTTAPPTFTGAAVSNSASFGLAVVGLFAAYFI